jgi:glycine cleavage system H protein
MNTPEGLYYTKEHEWVRVEDGTATVGITDYAQEQLGDITYVELPTVGAQMVQDDEFAVVESVKAASDIYAPVSGTVASVNTALDDAPESINQDPYGAGWICTLARINEAELAKLMDADGYVAFVEEED